MQGNEAATAPVLRERGWLERLRAQVRHGWGHATGTRYIWGQVAGIWALAQALPPDILDQLPLLRRLIGPIVAAIPSAESFVARSAFPQIAEVILALGWMLAGVNLLFGLLLPEHMHKARPRRVVGDVDDLVLPGRSATAVCWAGTAWIVAVAGLMWMLVALPIFDPAYGVDDEGALYAFTNRLTFGFVAQALSNLTGFAMAGCAVAAGHLAGSFVAFLRRDGSG